MTGVELNFIDGTEEGASRSNAFWTFWVENVMKSHEADQAATIEQLSLFLFGVKSLGSTFWNPLFHTGSISKLKPGKIHHPILGFFWVPLFGSPGFFPTKKTRRLCTPSFFSRWCGCSLVDWRKLVGSCHMFYGRCPGCVGGLRSGVSILVVRVGSPKKTSWGN